MQLKVLLLLPYTIKAACDLTRGKWVRDDAYRNQALQHYKQCSPKIAIRPSSRQCGCLLYTSPSPRDKRQSRMPSSA